MFVFTAKLNKRKALCFVIAFALVLAAIILAVSLRSGSDRSRDGNESALQGIRNAEDAAAYLRKLGWEVQPEPLEVREIVIPREFTGAYADYIALQEQQGFPIAQYGGMDAVRYSFRILNYPTGEENIVADLVVCGQALIAGDIQCPALDGFMVGLLPTAKPRSGV